MDIAIRSASIDDARDIACLHVEVWRETYRDIAPLDVQAALDETHREAGWRARLSGPGPGQGVFVAECLGRIAGVVAAGAPTDPIFAGRGEISGLYVGSAFQRRGIGRSLLIAAMRHLAAEGFPGAGLGVVAGNEPAVAFYRALHGKVLGRYVDAGPLWRSDNIAFAWAGDADLP